MNEIKEETMTPPPFPSHPKTPKSKDRKGSKSRSVASRPISKKALPSSSSAKPNPPPWPGCHSTAPSDWKLEHVPDEFRMKGRDWKTLVLEMERSRDEIAASEVDAGSWMDMDPSDIKTLAQMCVDSVAKVNKCTKHRLEHCKSGNVFQRTAEKALLYEILRFWFTRKWIEQARQAKLGPRDRKERCAVCQRELKCVSCDLRAKEISKMDSIHPH